MKSLSIIFRFIACMLSLMATTLVLASPYQHGTSGSFKYELVSRDASSDGDLSLTIVVERERINREGLERLFSALAKDFLNYEVISIEVWDDMSARERSKTDYVGEFPETLKHYRASYTKRSGTQPEEHFWFTPALNSKAEYVDLLGGIVQIEESEGKFNNQKFEVSVIEYQQLPSELYVFVRSAPTSQQSAGSLICKVVAKYPHFMKLKLYDDKGAAERAAALFRLPQSQRNPVEYSLLDSHCVGIYERHARGEGIGLFKIAKQQIEFEIEEESCSRGIDVRLGQPR